MKVIPTKKETSVAQSIFTGKVLFPISIKFAPNTIGIESRNENLTAFFSFSPKSRPDEIVVPLLDIPRKRDNI